MRELAIVTGPTSDAEKAVFDSAIHKLYKMKHAQISNIHYIMHKKIKQKALYAAQIGCDAIDQKLLDVLFRSHAENVIIFIIICWNL